MELIDRMLEGDTLSLARLVSMVERESPDVPAIMKQIYPHLGRGYTIGITGPTGAGKSTLVDQLIAEMRKAGYSVGVVCVDPSSPFSGGAVLGDRIRMQQHYLDDGVFIRSMSTRGSLGGLPRTAGGVVKLLNAAGKDFIIIETVGVGQTEVDIMENADTIAVILVPEAGDTIQTMKAGLFEIADIFVVNKADRPGADTLATELTAMLQINVDRSENNWTVPVMTTEAASNVGIKDLFEQIQQHRKAMEQSGILGKKRREQRKREFVESMENRIVAQLLEVIEHDPLLSRYQDMVQSGDIDPYSAMDEVLNRSSLVANWSEKFVRQSAAHPPVSRL
jgi:LAO/AO transport system kinase